VLSAEATN